MVEVRRIRAPEVPLARFVIALRRRGIVPDYRAPDLLRLAPVALYNTEAELGETVYVLRELLDSGSYKQEQVHASEVT